jgi:hypothetical protein
MVVCSMASENVLLWNVRGLHSVAHRNAVRDLVVSESLSLACLQETKLDVISDFDVIQILGSGFDYVYLLVSTLMVGFCLLGTILLGWWLTQPLGRTLSLLGFAWPREAQSGGYPQYMDSLRRLTDLRSLLSSMSCDRFAPALGCWSVTSI